MKYIRKYNKDGVIKESLSKIESDLDDLLKNLTAELNNYFNPIIEIIGNIQDIIMTKDDDFGFSDDGIDINYFIFRGRGTLTTLGIDEKMELDLLLDDSSQIKEIRDLINIKDLTKSRDASIEFGIEIKSQRIDKFFNEIKDQILSHYDYMNIRLIHYSDGGRKIEIKFSTKFILK